MPTSRERLYDALHFIKPLDRLFMCEWAPWWHLTMDRWKAEGFPDGLNYIDSLETFGLDPLVVISAVPRSKDCPQPSYHGGPIIHDESDYEAVLPYLYNDECIESALRQVKSVKADQESGRVAVRLWLDGYFWFPRTLFGIEPHMYAFYDYPALMHRINADLADFNRRAMDAVYSVLTPDMVNFAEDMSYNHGPMLSHPMFTEFLAPYYRRSIAKIKERDVPVLIDSDGDITTMLPWMREAGIDGVFPLERQAGVDLVSIRESNPRFLMMGGYDKMVMNRGEAAMRAEFERLLPVMRSGGYIPSVDHQTPPGVSLSDYRLYLKLFREYCEKAAQ